MDSTVKWILHSVDSTVKWILPENKRWFRPSLIWKLTALVVETVWQPFDENDFNFSDADNEYNDDFEGDDDCCNGKKRNYKKNGFIWEK